jgi:epoxide hydrolase
MTQNPMTARSEAATADIRPFRIAVPQADIDDLNSRLRNTRWPDELSGVGWNYGIPLERVKRLADYWRTAYNWREHEARLNTFPQYTTTVDRQHIHFLHVRSKEPDAIPLLMTHGWPGSIAEFVKVIDPLVDPRTHRGDAADAFHIVAPSIPGFGFSGPTHETGWDVKRTAAAFALLMSRLGYDRYGTHGGDWGSAITRELGQRHPENVIGLHFNTLATAPSGDPDEMKLLTDHEKTQLDAAQRFLRSGSGYYAIQSTRPQTLAYALTDSPVGQLAWMAEKFREWSDHTESDEAVDRDQLLTNVSIYWFTQTANSSARLYAEFSRGGHGWGAIEPSIVPAGVALFPREVFPPIRRFAERSNNIVHWSEFDRGGHFPAMEQPDLLVGDIRTFFRKCR